MDSLHLSLRKPEIKLLMLGGAGIAGMFHIVSREQAKQTIQKALDLGVTQFDTAPWYGAGRSEEYFGEVLSGHNIDIFTKVGRVIKKKSEVDQSNQRVAWNLIPNEFYLDGSTTENVPVHDFTYDGAKLSFQQSQERMKGCHIKCLRIHDAENHESENCKYYDEAIGKNGAMEYLVTLKEKKEISEISIGMNSPSYILSLLRHYPIGTFDNILMAGSWNLLDQSGLEVLLYVFHSLLLMSSILYVDVVVFFFSVNLVECQNKKINITLAGIFGGGMLWGENILRYRPAQQEEIEAREKWKNLCAKHNCTLQAAALHFAFLPTCVTSVCFGALSPENVTTNLSLCDDIVPQSLWQEAKEIGLLPSWFNLI